MHCLANLEILRLSFSALKERRVRSTLTILMVVIGTALVVSLNGLSQGFSVFIEDQFSLLSPNVLIVTPAGQFRGGGPRDTSQNAVDLNERTVSNLKPIRGVVDVVPVIQQTVTLKSGSSQQKITVMGIDQTKMKLVFPTFTVAEGNIVFPFDSVGALLGSEAKFPPGSRLPFAELGQSITMEYSVQTDDGAQRVSTESRKFLVRGVVKNLGSGSFIPVDRTVAISMKAAESIFNKKGEFSLMLVVTESPEVNDAVEKEIRAIYGNDIGIASPRVIVQTIQGFVSGFSFFFLGIAAISLVVAAVGVVTTLITSVIDRTQEIGLLKALGFKNRAILTLFLSEASIIGVIGGTIGVIGGVVLGAGVLSSLTFGPPDAGPIKTVFPIPNLIISWAFAFFLSVLAGLYPAWRASKLDAMVALKKE